MNTRTAILAVIVAILLVLVLVVLTGGTPQPTAVSPTPTATATATATVPPTSTRAAATTAAVTQTAGAVAGCENRYQQGDVPVVPPRTSGQYLQVALDSVVINETQQRTRWAVRFFDPSNAPGSAEIPLQAQITDAAGRSVTVYPEYEDGPPNAGSARVTSPITLTPCGAPRPSASAGSTIVLIIPSAPITSGRYVLTLGPAKLPEGGTRGEVFDVTLTCDTRPAPVGGVCR